MNPTTAVAFILCTVVITSVSKTEHRRSLPALLCALSVAAIGALKLFELISGNIVGIDTILYSDRLYDAVTGAPNHIAPNTAFNFAVLGTALLLLATRRKSTIVATQVLSLITIASSGLALLGYLFGVRPLYGIGLYVPMAVHTAVVFILLAAAVLSLHAHSGIISVVSRPGPVGAMARRLLLASIMVPLAIGWLRLAGEHAKFYSTELGVAIATIANIVAFASAVLWVARTLHQSDAKRSASEEALQRQQKLVELFRAVAEASNQTSFDRALEETLGVVHNGTSANWGVAFRLDGANETASTTATYFQPPETQFDLRSLVALARTHLKPTAVTISLGSAPQTVGTLIPVHNGEVATAALFLAGLLPAEGEDVAKYVQEQLSRTAERDRILVSLHDSVARHEALFTSASEGIITINESGTIESVNPAAETMFGYAHREPVRRHFGRLLEGVWLPSSSMPNETNQNSTQEAFGTRKDGSTFPVEASLNVMDLGQRKAFVAFVRDISERKRVEKLQSQFVSTVSHELRTPLTSIGGSLGLIAGGAAGTISEQASRLINIAHSNTQRLVRLVNDILDIEKLQSGQMAFKFAKIDLEQTIETVIAANQAFAQAHFVHFAKKPSNGSAWVWADGDRIVQALTNIVSNAIKFSPRGGIISISLSVQADKVRISVSDQGPGIPAEFQPRIFERFAQADSSENRKIGGSGLGLSIAREILGHHGGAVSFETAAGRGTTFHLDVPAFRAAAAEPVGDVAPCEAMRILVCAQDAEVRESVREVLSKSGFRAEQAASVVEAIAALAHYEVSALVVDTDFADGEISAFVRELQAQVGKQLPIIVLSPGEKVGSSQVYGLPTMSWIASAADVRTLPDIVLALLDETQSARPKILHVEDDADVAEVVRRSLQRDFAVEHAASLGEARRMLKGQDYQLILLDLTLADGRGTDLLPALVNRSGERIPTVVFTAEDNCGALGPRVEAVLTKSRENLATLIEAVHSVLAKPAPVNQDTIEVQVG
jgi:PAS domain S-box-containing protein